MTLASPLRDARRRSVSIMFSIFPEDFFLVRRKLAPVICASAKMRSTKTCAISTSSTKPAKCPTSDYTSLKSSLQDEAATILAEIDRLEKNPGAKRHDPGEQS